MQDLQANDGTGNRWLHVCACPLVVQRGSQEGWFRGGLIAKSYMIGVENRNDTSDENIYKVETQNISCNNGGGYEYIKTYSRDLTSCPPPIECCPDDGYCITSTKTPENCTGGAVLDGYSYSEPDSEEAANTYADNEATIRYSGSPIARYEDRGSSASYEYNTAKTSILITRLNKDKFYEGRYENIERTNDSSGIGEWERTSIDQYSFIADEVFEIVGGSLNSGITPQDFIDENYSINPLKYNLPDQSLVINPDIVLTRKFGYDVAIENINLEGYCV
jgi:hypothetical protein